MIEHSIPSRISTLDSHLIRKGLVYQWLTIGHAVLESLVALSAGMAAGSVVLFGFGLDSLIELLSASIVIWRLSVQSDSIRRVVADRLGLRFVGICFLALAAYVCFDSTIALYRHENPKESVAGIVLAGLSVVMMPLLARAKKKLALEIDSSTMGADSVQSELCAYLSGILLLGLVLNWGFGWWWADPVAALAMVPIIAKEGAHALKGKACGCASCLAPTTID